MNLVPLFPAVVATPRPFPRWSRRRRLLLALTGGIALLLAGYLVYMKCTGQISNLRGCGAGEGCANLLGGRWGSWLLLPVSLWALLAYVGLLGLCATQLRHWWSRTLAIFTGLLLLSAAIWFTFLQAVVERHFCLYCCGLHACGLVIATTLLPGLLGGDFPGRRSALRTAVGMTVATMVLLIAGQIWGPQPATHQIHELATGELAAATVLPPSESVTQELPPSDPPGLLSEPAAAAHTELPRPPVTKTPRTVSYLDGQIRYTVGELPVIGDPAAEHILVEYFDYTCESCRDMQRELERVRRLYPEKFAVIVVPTPLNRSCNDYLYPGVRDHRYACELSRLGLAMWRADPQHFAEFHEELFRQQGRITPQQARATALQWVDPEVWQKAEQDPWIRDTLRRRPLTYKLLCRSGPRMPKVLLGGRRFMEGIPLSTAKLVQELQRQLSFD